MSLVGITTRELTSLSSYFTASGNGNEVLRVLIKKY